ncbi:NAD(P)-dependent oxidoreductase [Desulfosporosinus fructosivorans]|uniref:NAD(P)-dependent oxidoreductase n=1 Tax=Desulfosporosinus fructosivorans TaxID=2018669 RepID=A0A4Z0QY03_9FIRM|nr:NAD(P)-dependent oxidoreductase [Desulfosporosinus fructosivorans]TGE35384.1 NAD(P)-dependent oxidoreductase [Desulfosporosinus fructosivorans]
MKRILITGSFGFIGHNLKEQLADNYIIVAPSHTELDLLDEEVVHTFLSSQHFDVVIHTATENATLNAKRDIHSVLPNNLRMFFNLARSHELYGKMYYFGSGAEYDRRYYLPKMPESYFDNHVPVDPYGFSKYVMAKYTLEAPNTYDLRLFGVFGKYEDWELRFISHACCRVIWDMPITIRQNVYFDYLYINDLVQIMTWFIENEPKCKAYNICSGQVYDLRTLAGKVLNTAGKDLAIEIARPGLGPEYSGNNLMLLDEIGGYTFADMSSAINELYQWYGGRKDNIDPARL